MDWLLWPFRLIGIYLFDIIPAMLIVAGAAYGVDAARIYAGQDRRYRSFPTGEIFGPLLLACVAVLVWWATTGRPVWLGWLLTRT